MEKTNLWFLRTSDCPGLRVFAKEPIGWSHGHQNGIPNFMREETGWGYACVREISNGTGTSRSAGVNVAVRNNGSGCYGGPHE